MICGVCKGLQVQESLPCTQPIYMICGVCKGLHIQENLPRAMVVVVVEYVLFGM